MLKEIIIVEGRWNFLGNITEKENHFEVTNAQNIRRWGTTEGLGQIALTGPTNDTVLDFYGILEIPKSKVLFRIKCEEW